jgi:hypothetical protein
LQAADLCPALAPKGELLTNCINKVLASQGNIMKSAEGIVYP